MSLAIFPVLASPEADFSALLRNAIDLEDEDDDKQDPEATPRAPSVKAPMQVFGKPTLGATSSRQHKKRRAAREKAILIHGYPSAAGKYLDSAKSVNSALETASLPVESGAYAALRKPVPQNPTKAPDIQRLIDDGFQYISCGENGIPSRLPQPILDSERRVIAVIAGAPPQDLTYDEHTHELFKIIIAESSSKRFTKEELGHKRGDFPAVNFGFTLPHGFKHPINLDSRHHEKTIRRITKSRGFARISGFQNASFAFWNPGVYRHQKSYIEQLLARYPELKRTTEKTIFPTTACNFRNVCSLGEFDHTRGGHLILWELKLIVEFPHAYTILIPSATITHSNTPVVDGDVRVSITQYCAGSIFRYAENGFRTDKLLRQEDRLRFEKAQAMRAGRWSRALGLLSKFKDLDMGKIPYVSGFQ
ncbi:hypothetical protein BJ912DRAFT_930519 [Pholiota molesta]|nr:hypothetical protein BJ912DRAFT_930519 [Pholiota molesta]